MPATIAVGSIFIECNHFGGSPANLETFRRTQLAYGAEILEHAAGTLGGMFSRLRDREATIHPLLVASGCPSGPVEADCYAQLKRDLLVRLTDGPVVDGVLLALHGAAAAEGAGDLEGDLLQAVRTVVGEKPIVATLDLHAHVTSQMVEAADALIAWETYPHADSRETGERGATAVMDIVEGKLHPVMALAKVPVLVGGFHGHTAGPGPFADTMRLAKSYEDLPSVYSTSAFLVHPYLDLPEMGGGGLVVTDGDLPLARELAVKIARLYWERRHDLEPLVWTPEAAITDALAREGTGPIVLVETADCCGGGAAGDSVATLAALLRSNVDQPCLVPVVDPAAAKVCHRAGEGNAVSLALGHGVDPQWGSPLAVDGRVTKLTDGRFRYRGGIWDGTDGEMGPTAVLDVGQVQVLIASHPTYEWCGEQFESVGLDARNAGFVVAKNPMNYRMAFGEFARATYVLDTPGPTPATLKNATYRNLERPYFPEDDDFADVPMSVFVSSADGSVDRRRS